MAFNTGGTYPVGATHNRPIRTRERWLGGGAAADCTKISKASGKNIASIAYAAATGKYTITFRNVGAQWLGLHASVAAAAGAATAFVAFEIVGSYSATAKTVQIQVSDVATPTAHDLAATENLIIDAEWCDSDQP
jgi:hypothetical protein